MENEDIHNRKKSAKRRYKIRFAQNLTLGILVTGIWLFIGMWGYHHYEGLNWVDAYANASMILSGMGPLGELKTVDGKIFAGTYAILSGILYLVVVAIIFAPIFHLALHIFHFEQSPHDR